MGQRQSKNKSKTPSTSNDPVDSDLYPSIYVVVEGYIRTNFDKKCWVEEIIKIIKQFYIPRGGSLFVLGKNSSGKLGIAKEHKVICKTPTLCPLFNANNCVFVAAYSDHTLMIDIDGRVYATGEGNFCALGTGYQKSVNFPTLVVFPNKKAIAVAVGSQHSMILSSEHLVYSFGTNDEGQLGLGHFQGSMSPILIEALQNEKVVQIECGNLHSAAITSTGALFMWGWNYTLQCGICVNAKCINKATRIELKDDDKTLLTKKVQCGDNHTLVLSTSHLMLSFGGRYKYDKESLRCLSIMDIAAGFNHFLAICHDGIPYSWGQCRFGALGHGDDLSHQMKPKEISYFSDNGIRAVACFAGGFSSAVMSSSRELYLFGDITGDEILLPNKIKMSHVMHVSLGISFAAMIVPVGRMNSMNALH